MRVSDFLVKFNSALKDNGDGTFSLITSLSPGGTVDGNLTITGDLEVQGTVTFSGTMASNIDLDSNKIYIGYAEFTPDVTITSDTNDGSTKPLVINDSDNVEVFSVDSK